MKRRRKLFASSSIFWAGRVAWAELAFWAGRVGYWVRPYDSILDDRRWRWQRRAVCGSQWWASLSPQTKATMRHALGLSEDDDA